MRQTDENNDSICAKTNLLSSLPLSSKQKTSNLNNISINTVSNDDDLDKDTIDDHDWTDSAVNSNYPSSIDPNNRKCD